MNFEVESRRYHGIEPEMQGPSSFMLCGKVHFGDFRLVLLNRAEVIFGLAARGIMLRMPRENSPVEFIWLRDETILYKK